MHKKTKARKRKVVDKNISGGVRAEGVGCLYITDCRFDQVTNVSLPWNAVDTVNNLARAAVENAGAIKRCADVLEKWQRPSETPLISVGQTQKDGRDDR